MFSRLIQCTLRIIVERRERFLLRTWSSFISIHFLKVLMLVILSFNPTVARIFFEYSWGKLSTISINVTIFGPLMRIVTIFRVRFINYWTHRATLSYFMCYKINDVRRSCSWNRWTYPDIKSEVIGHRFNLQIEPTFEY